MRITELIPFLKKRWENDSRKAFFCRIARFSIILSYYPAWQYKSSKFDGCICSQEMIHGSWMLLEEKDKGVSRELLINKDREPYATAILPMIIHSGDNCLDIGANIGYYALQEASLVKDTGTVYAIEPVEKNIKALRKNIKLNGYNNIIIPCKLACGSENKLGKINVSEKGNWSSISKSLNRRYTGQEEIEIVTVDNFLIGKETPQLIRMDVEGYELEILKGMPNLLASNTPLKMLIEVHFDILMEKTVELCQILKKANFHIGMASVEPHPMVMQSKTAKNIIRFWEKGIGPVTGYNDLTLDDLMNNPIFQKGQVEYMEILFERS